MKKGFQYRLALLMLGAAVMTGCTGTEEEAAETKSVILEGVAFPQAGEGSEMQWQQSIKAEALATAETEQQEVRKEENAGDETTEADAPKKKEKKGNQGTIKVATIGSPNTEILQQAALLLAEQGYQLEIEVCEDYLTPNQKVIEGAVDCNYYQHEAFMERYNIEYQTTLVEVEKIYYEPMVILSQKITDLSQVKKGMKVAISDNPTAVARAMWLLQDAKLVTLMSDADINTVKDDIAENPYALEFIFVDESQLLAQLPEADLVLCAKGFVLQDAMNTKDMLLAEEKSDSMMAQKLAQSVVATDAMNQKAKVLADTLLSEKMEQFIAGKYHGSICMMEEGAEVEETAEVSEETEEKK